MRTIRLLYVGAKPEQAWEALCESYRLRLSRHLRWEEVRIPLAKGRQVDPKGAVVREGQALLARVGPQDKVVALDQRGSLKTTADLVRFLETNLGPTSLTFVIGSDLGLAEGVRQRADYLWSLSPLTLPHEMVRLLVMEQIYRALDFLRGGRYHRGP